MSLNKTLLPVNDTSHDVGMNTETDLSTTPRLYCFAKATGGANAECDLAGAGDTPVGILQDAPLGASGKPVAATVRTGNQSWLKLGGTVTAGQFIKPSTNGVGIAVTTNKDVYGAQALADGVSGDLIAVKVVSGEASL